MLEHQMMAEQVKLEAEMRLETTNRYFREHDKAIDRQDAADTHAGRNLMDHLYEKFLFEVEAWAEDKASGGAGRRGSAYNLIEDFNDTPTLAYIFLRWVINTTLAYRSGSTGGNRPRKTTTVLQSVQAIHDEHRMRYFKKERRDLLRQIVKDFKRRELPRRRQRELMIRTFHQQQLEWQAEGWGQSQRLQLGMVLLDLLQRSTGIIEEVMVYQGRRSIACIQFTDELQGNLLDRMEASANLFTIFYPMVVPPKPWQDHVLVGGSYYTDDVQPYRLIKGAKMKYLSELENRGIGDVLRPINALQETPWRVNPVMLEVLDEAFYRNIPISGIPSPDPKELPPPPPGVDDDEEVNKEYQKQCYMTRDENRRSISKRVSVVRTIALARRFVGYEEIFFPYDLDSRGRVYPKPAQLNPQGPDYVKGLLEFAQGKPIETPEHEAYLAIAVANAWGQDKLPLQERVDWAEENTVMLQEVALDPLNDLRWTQADEPFMALRGALEWRGLAEHGPGYLSHMPVHFDATCSGLQHFSALLRDEEGGRFVNLTQEDERQDIYAEVARKATASLSSDTSDIARVALEMGISRSMCKRPVMIVPYAGTFSSCMEYVLDHYKERAEAGEQLPLPLEEIRKSVMPLVAKHIWKAIADTVIAAREAMDWITKTAREVSKANNAPVQWSVPDGLVVQQAKYKETTFRVKTFLDGGRIVRAHLTDHTNELSPKEMAQSLSPNYIHSLDACHMRMSIRKALDIGGMSFAMIHDSFGVHASDMPVFLQECIKPAFVEMYEGGDNLLTFAKEITVSLDEEGQLERLYALPESRGLDLQEVMGSEFFFS